MHPLKLRSPPESLRQVASFVCALLAGCQSLPPVPAVTLEPTAAPMLRASAAAGFRAEVLFSTGDDIAGYRPPGILDGLAAFSLEDGSNRVEVFATHELKAGDGYPYTLQNGTGLTGARITRFVFDGATRQIVSAGRAYREIRDRSGRIVTDARQVNERDAGAPFAGSAGLDSLCSVAGYGPGDYGFADRILFAHEEVTRAAAHPHGGTVHALDVATQTLWAAPELGRGSWENVAAVEVPGGDQANGAVALLLGDDLEFGRAPLYLWLGQKSPGGSFLERNGLARGQLHVWVAANGDRTPQDWSGSGSTRQGRFVPVSTRMSPAAPGTDALGYLDDVELRAAAEALDAFMFSRLEDLHTNPRNGRQVAFAATGQGLAFPADDWGGIYVVDMAFNHDGSGRIEPRARITLLYDSDETADAGIRNPDNLAWASDGRIYVQEDKAVKRGVFAGATGREASVWRLDPAAPEEPQHIAEIDRSALPAGTADARAGQSGEWESSGILDVTALFGGSGRLADGSDTILLLATVQAHWASDGIVGGARDLVEASQLLLLSGPAARVIGDRSQDAGSAGTQRNRELR